MTPTTSEADATLDYLDGDDNALTDVETGTDGHQVDLTAGEMKTIKVRVTAEDGTTTQTYTITMTRAETCDGVWCATLHVQPLGGGHRGCANNSPGDRCSNTAHLTEDEFHPRLDRLGRHGGGAAVQRTATAVDGCPRRRQQ